MIEQPETPTRNPLLLFLGFAALGAGLAIVLFGGSLWLKPTPVVEKPASSFALATAVIGESPLSTYQIVKVGEEAPDFTLLDLDGNPVSLSDFAGRPIILNFWATWCPPCRLEMPHLQAIFEAHQKDGLVILALDQDETVAEVRAYFVDEMGLTFTPLMDDGTVIANRYGAFNLPSSYFVNSAGVVTAVHRGPMTEALIEGYLAQTIPAP